MEETNTVPTSLENLDNGEDKIPEGNSVEPGKDKGSILERIRAKVGLERDKIARDLKRTALIITVVGALVLGGCSSPELSDPFKAPTQQVFASDSISLEKEVKDSPEMVEVWDRVLDFWPNARFDETKEYFFKEAYKYSEQYPQYSPELLLTVFTSIAMTESNGGEQLGPNAYSGASGWFQVVPGFHLGEFNEAHGKQYTEDDLLNNDQISIEVGTWALMRYANIMNIKECLKMFKGGHVFGNNLDDGTWWNRVSYSSNNLSLGRDILGMGFMDYYLYDGMGMYPAKGFLNNPTHIGNVYIPGSKLNNLVIDNLGN